MPQISDPFHTCAKCSKQTLESLAIRNNYKCSHCDYELAHIDTTATGSVRGVFGWLKDVNAQIGDRYKVETVLGKGGFGATYLVSDQRVLGKRWALKEIPEMLFDEYEASLLNQLDHQAIPIIVDRFTKDSMVYLVLKFGGSKTLATECQQQHHIPYPKLETWIIQLADVLTYMHTRNPPIIHRDLKPENILIDDQNRIMLIDFGIAKESLESTETRTIGRAASSGFSPPEQVLGTGTDIRSDIYSLAATLYFALVGKTPVAAHERVAGQPLASPLELEINIPVQFNVMLMKALSLNINERPQTISEFLTAVSGNATLKNTDDQSGKTVMISDIQFGPLINDGVRSSPLRQRPKKLLKKKPSPALILSWAVLLIAFSMGGYWFIDEQNGNKITYGLSNKSARTSTHVAFPEAKPNIDTSSTAKPALDTTQSKQSSNTTSAVDILNQHRKNQLSIAPSSKTSSQSAETALKAERAKKQARLAASKKEKERKRRAIAQEKARIIAAKKKEEKHKAEKTANWGNQQQGSF